MKTKALKLASILGGSFWFVPGLLVAGAVGLALWLMALDESIAASWLPQVPWVFGGGPSGARSLLSSIASSMITVAGVTFSITVVSLTLAAAQYTPRVLREFSSDRGNQVVLGTFLATFVYCLLVLRTIRAEGFGDFVPHLAMTGAVLLALVSVGLLIYFIHHVTAALRPNSILAAVTKQTASVMEQLFPQRLGRPEDDERAPEERAPDGEGAPVACRKHGYVESTDVEALMRIAREKDLVVRMEAAIGDFIPAGGAILTVWPAPAVDESLSSSLRGCFGIGRERTMQQDAEFGLQQIVDIAVKALSPGINDPTTAINCIDYLAVLLRELGGRRIPSPYRADETGALRVIARGVDFNRAAALALDDIRRYTGDNAGVTLHLLRVLRQMEDVVTRPERRAVLRDHVRHIVAEAEKSLDGSPDLPAVRSRAADALAALGGRESAPAPARRAA